jgi:hypothetical protein
LIRIRGKASFFAVDRRALASWALLWGAISCSGPRTSLVQDLEAESTSPEGRYASFLDDPSDRGLIRLSDDSRPSLTPPFPASLRFTLTLPEAAFLSFAPALVARQEVRRAGVEFVVRVDADVVYEEFFDFEDANQWHDREVDLSAWSGREVALTLETRALSGRTGKLWADRLQAVWGDPVVVSNRPGSLQALARGETARLLGFAWNLTLGGLLALAIRELFLRFGASPGDRSRLGNLFPVFTLGTIVVLTAVQVSIPLSLGLLGALSIVRFRSAIKTPEELVYLLFCVSVGLSLGAQHRLLSVVAVVVVGVFVLIRSRVDDPVAERSLLLSISGEASRFFDGEGGTVLDRLRPMVRGLELRRLDRDFDRVELSTLVSVDAGEVENFLNRLRAAFPGFDVACVSSDAVL